MIRAVLAVFVLLAFAAQAMEPVEVGDTRFARAELTVVGAQGEKRYAPAELEVYGTFAIHTVTPWREAEAEFVGIRLADLLEAHGIDDASAIRVVAENDYVATIEREAWTAHDALIATRVNGRGHSRRERGPLQIVFDMSADPSVAETAFQKNWVWMAARIEVAD